MNTSLAMIIALLVKDGEIPLMSQLPLFHTVRQVPWADAARATAASALQQAIVQPPLPEICLRGQVLNSGLNYLLQFPAPTGAYVQVTAPLVFQAICTGSQADEETHPALFPCRCEAPHARARAGGLPGVLIIS